MTRTSDMNSADNTETAAASSAGSQARADLLRQAGFLGAPDRRADAVGRLQSYAQRRGGQLTAEDAEDIVSEACVKLLASSSFVAPAGSAEAELEAFRRYAATAVRNAFVTHVEEKCRRAALLQLRHEARLHAREERELESGERAGRTSAHARARVSQSRKRLNRARQRANVRWRDMDMYHTTLEGFGGSHFPAPDRCVDLLSAEREAGEFLAPLSERDRTIVRAEVEDELDLVPFPSPAARRKGAERARKRLAAGGIERGLLPEDYQPPRSFRIAA